MGIQISQWVQNCRKRNAEERDWVTCTSADDGYALGPTQIPSIQPGTPHGTWVPSWAGGVTGENVHLPKSYITGCTWNWSRLYFLTPGTMDIWSRYHILLCEKNKFCTLKKKKNPAIFPEAQMAQHSFPNKVQTLLSGVRILPFPGPSYLSLLIFCYHVKLRRNSRQAGSHPMTSRPATSKTAAGGYLLWHKDSAEYRQMCPGGAGLPFTDTSFSQFLSLHTL